MSLLLVNLISMGLSAVSLIIFFAALRKASSLNAMSRLMANQIASSASNLQKALTILQAEREICRDESVRLEARLKDSDRARAEIAGAMELVRRAKFDLKDEAQSVTAPQASSAPLPTAMPVFVTRQVNNVASSDVNSSQPLRAPSTEPARVLPVFVNRIVRTSDVTGVVL